MNADEYAEWSQLCAELSIAPRVETDYTASVLLRRAINLQPDAPYILASRVALLQRVLHAAEREINYLTQQMWRARLTDRYQTGARTNIQSRPSRASHQAQAIPH